MCRIICCTPCLFTSLLSNIQVDIVSLKFTEFDKTASTTLYYRTIAAFANNFKVSVSIVNFQAILILALNHNQWINLTSIDNHHKVSITPVAEVPWFNQSYICRRFHRTMGIPPSSLRARRVSLRWDIPSTGVAEWLSSVILFKVARVLGSDVFDVSGQL